MVQNKFIQVAVEPVNEFLQFLKKESKKVNLKKVRYFLKILFYLWVYSHDSGLRFHRII